MNDDTMEITLPGPSITGRVSMKQVRQALADRGFVLTADTTFGEERWDPPGGDGSDWTILYTGPTAPSVMEASLGFAVSALAKLDGCSPGEMLERLARDGAVHPSPAEDEPNRYRVERAGHGWVRLVRPPLTLDRAAGIDLIVHVAELLGISSHPPQLIELERLRRLAGLDAEGNRIETGYTRSQLCAGADAAHEALHELGDDPAAWMENLEEAQSLLGHAHAQLHDIGCGLQRVGCATPDPEAQAIIADLSASREREIPCGHTVADLLGGDGSVTKCGACLALIQPGTRRRDAFIDAIRALTVDIPEGEPIAWLEDVAIERINALRDAAEAYFGISFRAGPPKTTGPVFYLVSTQPHTDEDKVLFWCRYAMGYTISIDHAGRYTAIEAAPHLSSHTFAVPCSVVESVGLRVVDIAHLKKLLAVAVTPAPVRATADRAPPALMAPLGIVDTRSERWKAAEERAGKASRGGNEIDPADLAIIDEEQAAYDAAHTEDAR